jgi:hypothetical protein
MEKEKKTNKKKETLQQKKYKTKGMSKKRKG